MTDREAFLKTIENGAWDDHSLRCIYTDWLEERGEMEEATRQRRIIMNNLQQCQWKKITGLLQEATTLLPPNDQITLAEDYLNHNELELACDLLIDAGYNSGCQNREFWDRIALAAKEMNLTRNLP